MSCYSHNDFSVLYKWTGSAAKGEWTEGSKAGENAHFNLTQSGHQKFSFFIIFKQTFYSYKKNQCPRKLEHSIWDGDFTQENGGQ